MHTEILILAWAAVLLFLHIMIAAHLRTRQYGTAWNIGARDAAMPDLNPLAGRAVRAQANFAETLPIAVIALFGIVLAGRTSDTTTLGGWIWLGARVAYVPFYLIGVSGVRTAIYLVSLVGLAMVLWPLLVA